MRRTQTVALVVLLVAGVVVVSAAQFVGEDSPQVDGQNQAGSGVEYEALSDRLDTLATVDATESDQPSNLSEAERAAATRGARAGSNLSQRQGVTVT